MGNTQGSCLDFCGSKRHLDSVETNGSGNSTRPLRNVAGEQETDGEETVNVLGSKSAQSSPNVNGVHSSSGNQLPISPDQLAIDLSQVSSDDFDPNDCSGSHRSIERESEEPILTSSIKPFNSVASGKKSGSASSHSSVRGQSPTDLVEREERERKQQQANKPTPPPPPAPPLTLRQQNNQRNEPEYEPSSNSNLKQYLSSTDLDNSKDDIELSTNNLTADFQDNEEPPSPLRETDDDFDSFYEKKGPEGVDIEEKVKFFSQKSASTRSVKSEDSEHESSKLNHFKKLGRATLVTDGTSSLLSGRGGRGNAHKNRKSAVTLSAKPESQRDSYGSSKLTKEELQLLAEAAKNPSSSSTISSTNSASMITSDAPPSQNHNHSKPSQPSISPSSSNLPTIFE